MVNKELVFKKLKELEFYLPRLNKYKGITPSELENDLEKLWIIERGLQICIQIVLDVGNHVLAEKGISIEQYKDIFVELGKHNVLPKKFAEKIKGMAGLRNIIVHEYASINLDLLTGIVNNSLGDFKKFAEYIMISISSDE